MPTKRKLFILLTFAIFISTIALLAADKNKSKKLAVANVPAQMDDDKRILHALNRFTFGPRPGDVEKVHSIGLDKWFEEQLHPEKIDDSASEARLGPFRTLKMSTSDMVENFPSPQVLKAVENGQMSMPSDPGKRAIYESRMAAYQQKQQQDKQQQKDDANPDMKDMKMDGQGMDGQGEDHATPEQKQRRQKRLEAQMYADVDAVQLLDSPPDQRYKNILKMTPEERVALGRSLKGGQVMQLVEGMTPQQTETIQAIVNPQAVVGGELAQAKLLRAVYSERQLDEVMSDFWFNHFNVFIGKGPDRYMITAYERDVIRPHALGKFKDLLIATAKSPAMLFYLDNWQSVGPDSDLAKYGPQRRQGFKAMQRGNGGGFGRPRFPNGNQNHQNQGNNQQQAQAQKNRPSGLNENYAREIMELHTLGVDGGYTQKDVTELAKVLTGWSIQQPQRGGDFTYNERAHEPGTKRILGHEIREKGEGEGMEMLDILARHPATAKFISKKLAMRFVSDTPPQSLIDRMAETFLNKDGDIREVLRTMFRSPEFWGADAYRAKVKTPLEFVASAVRASSVDVQNALPLVQTLNRMGMPLYGMQPPTGYSMKGDTWVNSSALVNRMNFALQLGAGRLPGMTPHPQTILQGATATDTDSALAMMEQKILGGDLSGKTHAVIQKQLADPQVTQRKLDDPDRSPNYGAIAGLIMGSPEFQKR